jgi:hypothetical protein
VVVCNHADHSFWLGVHVADVVADIRPAGRDITIGRRGIPAASCAFIPIPGFGLERGDASRARQGLQVPPEAVLLLTVADERKYRDADPHLSELLATVMAEHDNVWLVVVGPGDDPPWPGLRERFGGRVALLPPTPELDDLRAAADIYVDSYPTGSLTSLLDSAALGTPALSLQLPAREASLRIDVPVMEALDVVDSPPDFVRALSTLVASPEQRADAGARAADGVRRLHSRDAVEAAVIETYRLAAGWPARRRQRPRHDRDPSTEPFDVQVARAYEAAGWVTPFDDEVAAMFPEPRSFTGSTLVALARTAGR